MNETASHSAAAYRQALDAYLARAQKQGLGWPGPPLTGADSGTLAGLLKAERPAAASWSFDPGTGPAPAAVESPARLPTDEAAEAEARQRRQIELSLRHWEEELADLFENAPVGIHRLDQDGTIREVNQAELELLGYARADFIGHPISEFFPDREAAERLWSQFATQKRVRSYETCLRCQDGALKHVLIDANVFRMHEEFVHAHCFVRDITERKQAEAALLRANDELESAVCQRTAELLRINEALQAEMQQRRRVEEAILDSERRHRLIVETAAEGIWLIDADNRTTFVNRRMAEMLGCDPADMIGRPVQTFLVEEYGAGAREQVAKPRQDAREQRDFRLRHRDGTEMWGLLSTRPIYTDEGRYAGALAMVTDVTQRKQAEEELRKGERQLAQAQRLARLGSWEWDLAAQTVTWSDEMSRICGLPAGQRTLSLDAFLACVHAEDRPRVRAAMDRASQTGEIYDVTHRIVRPDGTERIVHGHGEMMANGDASSRRMIGAGQDITEREQAEVALRQSEEHYRELFHQAFLMQEQLRNLSNRILAAQEEERRRISRELHDEVGQALTAVNVNLVMLNSEAAASNGGMARRIQDMQHLVEETMENVHRFARELRPALLDDLGLLPALRSYLKDFGERTGAVVRLAAPAVEARLDGDQKTVLYRVAQESLNNIAKHAQATEVKVTLREVAGRIHMEIRDNGRGFQSEAHAPGKESKRLGLLGMEERVRLSDGAFHIESHPGKGTRVRVEIPVRNGSPPAAKSENP